jgi:acyl-coenzyme A thioesterase PaaI-like protein
MKFTPKLLKRILNLYPPYLGAGVKVTYISEDWKELHVSMSLRWYNRNAVGTHFGGSLYSMIDPHLMLLLMQLLGKEYLVWDKSAGIEFVKASKKKVKSVLKVSNEDLKVIRRNTNNGEKYFSNFIVEIRDEDDDLVARVKKTIYVRRKQHDSEN